MNRRACRWWSTLDPRKNSKEFDRHPFQTYHGAMESKDLHAELESLQAMARSAQQRILELRRRIKALAQDLSSLQAGPVDDAGAHQTVSGQTDRPEQRPPGEE